MSITVAKSAGFCFGVNRAVDLVEKTAGERSKVVTLGPIIHNRHVVEKFENLGVRVIETPADAGPDMTVIIRSHGVTRAVLRQLEARGATVLDATCPFVKRIHDLVSKADGEGRLSLIIGTPSHPEVEGIAGWCDNCRIFAGPEELEKWVKSGEISPTTPITMVSQTTSTEKLWKKSCEIAKKTVY